MLEDTVRTLALSSGIAALACRPSHEELLFHLDSLATGRLCLAAAPILAVARERLPALLLPGDLDDLRGLSARIGTAGMALVGAAHLPWWQSEDDALPVLLLAAPWVARVGYGDEWDATRYSAVVDRLFEELFPFPAAA